MTRTIISSLSLVIVKEQAKSEKFRGKKIEIHMYLYFFAISFIVKGLRCAPGLLVSRNSDISTR